MSKIRKRFQIAGLSALILMTSSAIAQAHSHSRHTPAHRQTKPARQLTTHDSRHAPINPIVREKLLKASSSSDIIEPVRAASPEAKRQILCTALAVYHEARSDGSTSQYLMASLVTSRVHDWHLSACDIIAQKHQFDWSRHSLPVIVPHESDSWKAAQKKSIQGINHPAHVIYTMNRKIFRKKRNFAIVQMTRNIVYYNILSLPNTSATSPDGGSYSRKQKALYRALFL